MKINLKKIIKEEVEKVIKEDELTSFLKKKENENPDAIGVDFEGNPIEPTVTEGLFDFLKKKKEEAPKPKQSSSTCIGVDYDGNYIYKDSRGNYTYEDGRPVRN